MSFRHVAVCSIALCLAACGGTKLVKNAPPPPSNQMLAASADGPLAANLDWVIVRNGPGTWARNADWDEYLLHVRNTSDRPLHITAVTVTDSLGHRAEPLSKRKTLVKASKQTVRRYRDSDIKVKAGRGGGTLIASGVGATTLGVGAAYAEAAGALMGGSASSGAGAVAGGLLIGGPVLVGLGVVRIVRNAKVDNRIQARHSPLPLDVPAGAEASLDVFFPISPSPAQLELAYDDGSGVRSLVLDTQQSLAGLHLPAPDEPTAPIATAGTPQSTAAPVP
ncbi:hypothetical protein J2X06_003570 [Lysobacter niastensis]|uniref:Lipoprotein n=1 Tax=Lysobacter niastensis TaxID=380629 RepID=A0ABU1WG29_9GAMM|nr:hypothetical protein [Lysobacter niastensis]MDR7136344.1 hypothetical protein [Lysobacter niastensis]